MERNLVCSECSGTMQEGYVLGIKNFRGWLPSIWIEGAPEKSIWLGLKTIGKTKHYISAYRCKKCGFLKLYARSDNFNNNNE